MQLYLVLDESMNTMTVNEVGQVHTSTAYLDRLGLTPYTPEMDIFLTLVGDEMEYWFLPAAPMYTTIVVDFPKLAHTARLLA